MEFHGENLEKACYSLGIEIHYSARKTPWFKGKIERFLGTINKELAHGNPGTTFSNIFEKGEYDPLKHAVIRYSTFQKIYRKWIADIYHQELHRTLKATPASVWKSAINSGDIFLPNNVAQLDAILSRSETRTLTHKGIELDGLLYNSHELAALRRNLGEKFQVQLRVDDFDLGKIIVISPSADDLFTVPALLSEYANGLSRYQHQICKRFSKKHLNQEDALGCLQAKEMILDWINQESQKKPKKISQKITRFKGDKNLLSKPNAFIETTSALSKKQPSTTKIDVNEDCVLIDLNNANTDRNKRKIFKPIISTRNPIWNDE